MSRLLHLNGPPGIGKSTLARRYAADHPGVLVCDIDVLRSLIGGWEDDFGAAGALWDALDRLLATRPGAVVVRSVEGAEDETYRDLLASLTPNPT